MTVERLSWRCRSCWRRRTVLVGINLSSEGREFAVTCACGAVRWFRIEGAHVKAEAS